VIEPPVRDLTGGSIFYPTYPGMVVAAEPIAAGSAGAAAVGDGEIVVASSVASGVGAVVVGSLAGFSSTLAVGLSAGFGATASAGLAGSAGFVGVMAADLATAANWAAAALVAASGVVSGVVIASLGSLLAPAQSGPRVACTTYLTAVLAGADASRQLVELAGTVQTTTGVPVVRVTTNFSSGSAVLGTFQEISGVPSDSFASGILGVGISNPDPAMAA
jgi:hypothetical protein